MTMFNYESEEIYQMTRGETKPSSPVYVADCKKEILTEVTPNYPKLTEYEKEWISFAKNIYKDGTPVPLEYLEVQTYNHTTVENAIPFVYKSASLKGNTLVNLYNAKNRSETLTPDSRFFHCNISKTLKANAIYTFIVTITNSTTTNPISLEYKHSDGTYSYSTLMDAGKNGIVNINISNKKDITKINIYISNKETGQVVISDVMIIEGDYTGYTDVSYFQGMQSVKMPVLTTTNGEPEFIEVDGEQVPNEAFKSNILTVNEEVELGSVGEVKDELDLLTGKITQRTDIRPYQESDESDSEVLTDMTNTRYKLAQEVVKTVDLSRMIKPYEGTNHYIVSSNALPPQLLLSVPIESTGNQTLNDIITEE